MDTKFVDRRQDTSLRAKVDNLRTLLVHKVDVRQLLERTLHNIMDILETEYGVAASITVSENLIVSTDALLAYTRTQPADSVASGSSRLAVPPLLVRHLLHEPGDWLNAYAKQYVAHGKPIYLNHLSEQDANSYFPGDFQPIRHALIMPLMSLDQCFGVLLLISVRHPFSNKDVMRIWPLITTCGLIYRTHNTRLLNQAVLQNFDAGADEKTKLVFVSHDAIITVDQKHMITAFNPAAEKIFKVSSREAIGCSLEEFIPSNVANNQHITFSLNSYSGIHSKNINIATGFDAAGHELSLNYEIFTFTKQDQRYTTYVLRDLSRELTIRQKHADAIARLKAITDLAPVGILQTDADWLCTYVNEAWCQQTGMTSDEAMGLGWINAIHSADVQHILGELHDSLRQGQEYAGDVRFMNVFGVVSVVQINARPLYDEFGYCVGFLATFIDVTNLRNTEQKLRYLAEQDSLTGLSNRNAFMTTLQNAINRSARRGPIGVVYLDLDGFKHINDTLGHDRGDILLQTVSERIRNITRREDTVARIGGDEFTMILEALHDPRFAAEMVNNILRVVAKPFEIDSQILYISASAGIAIGDQNSEPKALLRQADTALYKAKAAGRNNYQYFTQEMTVAAEARLVLHNELHSAVANKHFVLLYQPQVSLKDASIIGNEALLRWLHPGENLRTPDMFLDMLEEAHLIVPLGVWIMEEACRQHQQWLNEGLLAPHTTISVNISASQFYQMNLPDMVLNVLHKTGLPANNLVLEITETVVMQNIEKCRKELLALKSIGVKVSLDDFGTGYSSLSQLCDLPIDELKLDKSFIDDLLNDPKKAIISESVITLGRELGVNVLAEGIDSEDKLIFLISHGCQSGQGYYFSEPDNAQGLREVFASLTARPQPRQAKT